MFTLQGANKTKETNMKKFGSRNFLLVKQAVGGCGTFEPDEVLPRILDELYVVEYEEVKGFLQYLVDTGKSMGSANYEERFKEYKKSACRGYINKGEKMKDIEQKEIKDRYNRLTAEYFKLRGQADKVKNEIQKIEGLVEYEV